MAEKIHKSRISNTEWGLVIGTLLLIDVIQILLDLLVIGAIINRGIDFLVGLGLGFYLQVRGEKLNDPKRLFGLLAVFGLEFIPGVDALPLWALDGVYNFILARTHTRNAAKQEAEQIKVEKRRQMQVQQERAARLQQVREQQYLQRQAEQNQADNQDKDQEDLYEDAA